MHLPRVISHGHPIEIAVVKRHARPVSTRCTRTSLCFDTRCYVRRRRVEKRGVRRPPGRHQHISLPTCHRRGRIFHRPSTLAARENDPTAGPTGPPALQIELSSARVAVKTKMVDGQRKLGFYLEAIPRRIYRRRVVAHLAHAIQVIRKTTVAMRRRRNRSHQNFA